MIGLGALGAVAATISATGAVYQVIATERDRRKLLPPGRMVDAGGGVRLHMVDQGEGSPTVILEAGLTSMSAQWAWVQPHVAKFTRVIAYDRAGLGWSDGCEDARDARVTTARLRTMLKNAGVDGPFILVGHSLGGLFARMFAHCYPEDVVGLVLLDSVHPDQRVRWGSESEAEHAAFFRQIALAPWLARMGVLRVYGYRMHMVDGLPEDAAQFFRAHGCTSSHWESTHEEAVAFDRMCDQDRAAGDLGNLPLAVISAGRWERGWIDRWLILQGELAALSSNSTFQTVEGSDHVSLITHQKHAQVTVDTIRRMVDQIRVRVDSLNPFVARRRI